MDFDFSEEQYLLRDTVRDLLRRESSPAQVRAMWDDERGRSPERWRKLAELGVLGLLVPEQYSGSGLDEVDMVLVLEESGRSVLPEPVMESAALAAPLLARAGTEELKQKWLPKIADGSSVATVGLASQPYVSDATADLLLLERDGEIHAVTQDRVTLQPLKSVDGARRLFKVTAETGDDTLLGTSAEHGQWAFDHAAAATAAQLIGIAGALLDKTVEYVTVREQFGRKVGSFQAVQHRLAEMLLQVESARSAVYYAAYALANDLPDASVAASVAKAAANDAERFANQNALQLHGGIGFTWEHDLHLWLKRGKALEWSYGDADLHRRRIADWIYSDSNGRS
ncbi:MAG TPA: acyl-CoA dehydrogenase family protein [Candidatus Dormibacteraeota bacterium]|nr:acyl-CoA dehydrogenase family protein [Candidatus Dormibacteraeota bacterium]